MAVHSIPSAPGGEVALDDDAVLGPNPLVAAAQVGDHLVLHDRTAELSHVLNPSAALIWSFVDGVRDVRRIIADVAVYLACAEELVAEDVTSTLRGFVRAAILLDPADGDASVAPSAGAAVPLQPDERVESVKEELLGGSTVYGPLQASGAVLVVRTNDASVVSALDVALEQVPAAATSTPISVAVSRGEGPAGLVEVCAYDAGPSAPRRFRVFVDGLRTWWSSDSLLFPGQVLSELNEAVMNASVGYVRMHAGAVERDGRVVLIAGSTGRGKSTLTAALVQEGWRYLTDEVVSLSHEDLTVLPYPKAFDLNAGSLSMIGLEGFEATIRPSGSWKSRVPVSALGESSSGGTLALVVLLEDPDPASPGDQSPDRDAAPDVPPAAQALVDLITNAFDVSFAEPAALDTLLKVVETVPVVRVPRIELPDACALVESSWNEMVS